jgi:hypothetical protein
MTAPIIPPHKLTMSLMTSVVDEISDCGINTLVDAEARKKPRKNPPTTFEIFIWLLLLAKYSEFSSTYCDGFSLLLNEMTG